MLPPALLSGSANGDADRPLTLRETKQLMVPLIRLRQACCHPQASALSRKSAACCLLVVLTRSPLTWRFQWPVWRPPMSGLCCTDCRSAVLAACRRHHAALHHRPVTCHCVQVGAGGIKTLGGGRTVLSMEEILESLTTKARVEAEDAQRQLLGALNGLAALMLLSDDDDSRPRAVATYRQALTTGLPIVGQRSLAMQCCVPQ